MEEGFSVFEYMYRDGGNFKTGACLLLSGHDQNAEAEIRRCLEWDDQFVAEQIGVPSLCEEHWKSADDGPSDLDHAFHEFVGLRPAGAGDLALPVWGTLGAMLERMQKAAGKWDVTLSPNCDL